jgi:MoxR-like ATPase
VICSNAILDYAQRLIAATRSAADVRFGLSPRGALALLNCARGYAYLQNRSFVMPEDIQAVFVAVTAHRLSPKELGASARQIAERILKTTPAI